MTISVIRGSMKCHLISMVTLYTTSRHALSGLQRKRLYFYQSMMLGVGAVVLFALGCHATVLICFTDANGYQSA